MTEAFRSPAELSHLVVALANARDNLSRAQAILAIVGTTSLVLLGVWRLVRDWFEENP